MLAGTLTFAEPLLIFGMSSNDVAVSPESLSTYLTKTGKNLSSSSLFPSAANLYQWVNNSSSFRLLVICFATAPVSMCGVVFVWPHQYLFPILESGNMFLISLAAWSTVAVLKESVFNQESRKKQFSFHKFLNMFAVAEVALKSVNFLCCFAASTYPYALRSPCNSKIAPTQYMMQNLHHSGIPEWI